MKPPPFRYARPDTVDQACALLATPGARALAGGQSLVPLLNQRAVRPDTLVDLAGVAGLDRIVVDGAELVIGAMARQHAVETSDLVGGSCPLLVQALRHVAHVQVRARGTVVGSLVQAEPAAELPTALVALGGRLVVRSVRGTRTIAAEELYLGARRTTLAPDELAVEVRLPLGWSRTSFVEEAIRHNDLPIVSIAVVEHPDPGPDGPRPQLTMGSADGPRRLLAGSGAAPGAAATADSWAAAVAAELGSDRRGASHADRIAPVLVRRALEALVP